MHFEPDGSFEVIISHRQHPGNWLRSEPDTRSLAIRQTFLDRPHQEHASLSIERLDDNGSREPLTPEELYLSLVYAGLYVKGVAEIGARWAARQAQWPNVFTDQAESEDTNKFKDPQIKWHQAYFDLDDDEALVVEFMPPECEYWMIALHNHWMETLDYVHHQATLNCHSAQVQEDGRVRFIIAERDPGLPNWLDTAGHKRGTVGVRWVGPNVEDVLPSTSVLKLESLTSNRT